MKLEILTQFQSTKLMSQKYINENVKYSYWEFRQCFVGVNNYAYAESKSFPETSIYKGRASVQLQIRHIHLLFIMVKYEACYRMRLLHNVGARIMQ